MIVVDSSGWIEHLTGSPRAKLFAPALSNPAQVLVPSIVLYEVHRFFMTKADEEIADSVAGLMATSPVIPVDDENAIEASRLSKKHRLAFADAMIYACCRSRDAELWTQDAHFKGLPEVRYFAKG